MHKREVVLTIACLIGILKTRSSTTAQSKADVNMNIQDE